MANEVYLAKGTSKLCNGEVGADVAWTVQDMGATSGQVSAQIDWGAAPRPVNYEWSCEVMWKSNPVQGVVLELYVAGAPDGDATQIDGDQLQTDSDLDDADARRNMRYIGCVVAENADTTKNIASGNFEFTPRYMSLVAYNTAAVAINGTAANFRFNITPVYWQGQ